MGLRNRDRRQANCRCKPLSIEQLEVRQLLAGDWQNPGQPLDVNRDLTVSPIDALLGINRLNTSLPRTFPPRAPGSTEPYFNVDGNVLGGSELHNALDILLVINALNDREPTVSAELLTDTGSGSGANVDRRTSDLSIRGNISMGRATELWGRFEGDAEWHLLKTFPANSTDQTFSFQQSDLVTALGGLPSDGLVTFQFQPRFGANNAEIGGEMDLPVTLDRTPPQSNFEEQPNFLGAISMSSATTIEVPLNERANPFTLVASKVKLFNATFSGVVGAAEELIPRGISLSSDGRFLLIEPPSNSESISYRVIVEDEAFEDLAGNLNVSFETLANYFSSTSQTPLTFGQKIDVSATQRLVKEYTFELTSPDLFMLAGFESAKEVRLDLLAPSGRSLRSWTTETTGGQLGLGAANWVMLTELGKYTLRVSIPTSNSVSFKALLGKLLASVPPSLQLQGTFTWPESQAFSLNVNNQDRVYFENNRKPETPFRIVLLNQYGQEVHSSALNGGDSVANVPGAGRYIVLIEATTADRPTSYDFSVHLSQTTELTLTFDQLQQSTLVTPGQQVFYNFAAQAGQTYTLEIESVDGDVIFSMPGVLEFNQAGAYPAQDSGDGFVLLTLNQADISSALMRFRLVETISTVTPPVNETINAEPLQQGITQRTLVVENESYEFTFAGNTGELFAFRDADPTGGATYEVLAPTGAVVQHSEQTDDFRVFRIPYTGAYRLRALGDIGAVIAFQWQRLSTATTLNPNAAIQRSIPQEFFAAYRFVSSSTRFFVYPTADADSLTWQLIDDNGKTIALADFNIALEADIVSGRTYVLVIEKLGDFASSEFEFRRRNPASSTRNGTVGIETTGNLAARGDRVVVEYSLVAGQSLELTSNLDPGLARVRWLDFTNTESDGPLEIEPNAPILIGSTRKYRVEIQNLTDAAVAYSIQFDSILNSPSPPSILTGFDQIRTGTVGSTPQTFNFDVTADAYYMFDWLLEENPDLAIQITDPSGNNFNSLASATDSSLARSGSAGVLTVEITNTNFTGTPSPFSFRMISPSTAESISLGVTKSASVIAFGTTFFKVGLNNTTEVFLQSTLDEDNSTSLFRLGSAIPFGPPFEGPFINGQFLRGDAFVWASNVTSEPYATEFTAFDVASLSQSPLNSPINLQTDPGVIYLLPFKTTAANTIIGAAGFAIADQSGRLLEPILGGAAFLLKHAGDYRAVIIASNATTQIELHTQDESNATANLATPLSGTIPKVGDVRRYSIALTAGSPILLSLQISDQGFARWIAPNGQVSPLLSTGSNVLPVYTTGTYQLEIYSRSNDDNFLLELNDLNQGTAITPGLRSGNTGSGLIEINRITASPMQLMELQDASDVQEAQFTLVDRLGNVLPQVIFAERLFSVAPADGVAYILVESLTDDTGIDFSYFIELVTTQSQAGAIGQPITGTLASRLEGKAYTFQITQPTWLRVSSTSTLPVELVLQMADGTVLNSQEAIFALVLPGTYEVAIYNDARALNDFTLHIDLLSQTPAVTLNQTVTINKAGRYRVDVSTSGRFELILQNSSNAPLLNSELMVTDLRGNVVSFDPRGTLEKGSYWLTFKPSSSLPSGDYKLKASSITTTDSVVAVGSLGEFTLNANGLQEYLISVFPVPGMRLLIDELEMGSGSKVEVRFDSDMDEEWASVDQLPPIFNSVTGNEILRFRISGTGSVRLHVIDLNAAPPLPLGVPTNVDLNARRRAQAFQIGGNVGDIIDFINNSSTTRPARWMIVDEAGRIVVKEVNMPINFAIVNRQRLVLVVVATEPLTSTLNVSFSTVVS